MARKVKESSDFVAASLTAILVSGIIYIGVLLLNDAEQAGDFTVVQGAIRIAQPHKDKPTEPLKRKELKEAKPPKNLPKTFSSKARAENVKPRINISTPNFSADMHSGLKDGIAMPTGDLGGIGFSMDEVDEAPQVTRRVPPEYPYGAKRNHIEGEVIVRMLVTSQGKPSNLSIHSATPSGVFETAALNAANRWKFRPGYYKGQAVDTWVIIPFNFELTQ
ncbi:TonB family protein [Oleidesulfovibrio sp.]|uniref:energy transducer TonB n=1 Tax=Oleidesulfovibrio sp. TaxID=2909707 RepID=UPI003A881308